MAAAALYEVASRVCRDLYSTGNISGLRIGQFGELINATRTELRHRNR
jgi:hypothetical protein